MYKLLLISVMIAAVALPVLFARDSNPRRGIKRMALAIVAFDVIYLLALKYIYPRLFYPKL